jgi:hypothetical protein
MVNLREKILNACDIEERLVRVEAWDCEVKVKGLTGADRAKILKNCMDEKGKPDFEKMYPDLIIASCYNPEMGDKIFGIADRAALASKSAKSLEQLFKVACELSGLDERAAQEIEKN